MPSWATVSKYVSGAVASQIGATAAMRQLARNTPGKRWLQVRSDAAPSILEQLAQEHGAELETVDPEALGELIGAEQFDLILLDHSLEKSLNPLSILRDVKSLLTEEGSALAVQSHLRPPTNGTIALITPPGIVAFADAAGLTIREIRAGVDGETLIKRHLSGNAPEFNQYFSSESPLNGRLRMEAKEAGITTKQLNVRMLQVCGMFVVVLARTA